MYNVCNRLLSYDFMLLGVRFLEFVKKSALKLYQVSTFVTVNVHFTICCEVVL